MEEIKWLKMKDDCGIIELGNYHDSNAYRWQTGGMSCTMREIRGKLIYCKQMQKQFRTSFRNFTSELARNHIGCMYSTITDINWKNNKDVPADKLSEAEMQFIKDKILEFKLPFRLLTDDNIFKECNLVMEHNTEAAIIVQNIMTKNYYCIWYNNCD